MRIKWKLAVGREVITDEIEVDDNATDEEIEEEVNEDVQSHICWIWERSD